LTEVLFLKGGKYLSTDKSWLSQRRCASMELWWYWKQNAAGCNSLRSVINCHGLHL